LATVRGMMKTKNTQHETAGAQPDNVRGESGEYGDRWEPLRSKLTIREAQYLNTYTKTGDIAALNALVLGILEQRNELLASCKASAFLFAKRLKFSPMNCTASCSDPIKLTLKTATEAGLGGAYLHSKLAKVTAQRDQLLKACQAMVNAIDKLGGVATIEYPFALKLSKARYKGKAAIVEAGSNL